MLTASIRRVEPRVSLSIIECRPDDVATGTGKTRWRVSWGVRNIGPAALGLQAAWIPHGRFRGDGRLPLSGELEAGESTRLEFGVSAAESPGTVVENAFLILRVTSEGRDWRIFTRMRIEFDAQATPRPIVEAVTTQTLDA
jgi:hypothetical protein